MDEYRFTSITPQICNIIYAQCGGVFNLLVSLFNFCHIHEAGAKYWIDVPYARSRCERLDRSEYFIQFHQHGKNSWLLQRWVMLFGEKFSPERVFHSARTLAINRKNNT